MKPKDVKKFLKYIGEEILDNAYEKYFIEGGMEELIVCFADYLLSSSKILNERNSKALFFSFLKDLDSNESYSKSEHQDAFSFSMPIFKSPRVEQKPYVVRNKIYIPPPKTETLFLAVLSDSNIKVDTLHHLKEIMAQIKGKGANLANEGTFTRLCCNGLAKGITTKMDYRTGSGFITRFWQENKKNKDLLAKAAFVCQLLGYNSTPIDFLKGEFNEQFILSHFKTLINQKIDFNCWRNWFIDLTGDRRDYLVKFYKRKLSRLDINEIFRDFYEIGKDKHETKQDLYNHFDRWFAKINWKYFPQAIDN